MECTQLLNEVPSEYMTEFDAILEKDEPSIFDKILRFFCCYKSRNVYDFYTDDYL